MLHIGDTVEEVATKRQGEVQEAPEGNQQAAPRWRVRFFPDGKKPIENYFLQESDLRLVERPHNDSGPGFVPERGIMGWWNRLRGRR